MEEKEEHSHWEEHHHEEHHVEEEKAKWWKSPVKIIIALFLLLIMVLWIIPSYSIRMNPEPRDIPTIDEINSLFLDSVEIGNKTGASTIKEALSMADADNPVIKQIATKISTQSCPEARICHAKALYYFVRDNIKYVSDPFAKEYVASPTETLKVQGGDCDDGALLLAMLVKSIGIRAEIVTIPGHAFIKALIPEAPQKYEIDGWIYMDWTCKNCKFGEIPYNNVLHLSG